MTVNLDNKDKQARDQHDLNIELAGLDVSGIKGFMPKIGYDVPGERQKKSERAATLTALQMIMLHDAEYARRLVEFQEQLSRTDIRLAEMHLEAEALIAHRGDMLEMLRARAGSLPDGTRVYRDRHGAVFDEAGKEIDVEQDYVVNDDFTYVLLVTHGTVPGVGTRTMAFLRPTEDSDVTTVQVPAGCDPDAPILDFSAELSAEAGKVPREGPWVVDWKDVTRDGQGNELAYASIDRVLVGFYEGMTVSDIEDRILDIEILPTALWEAELSGGRSADLADTKDRDNGTPFEGFERDEEGVWLFGLTCSTCQNPAPLVLAVLEPSEG
jgi:hypothetical protein